MTQYVHIKSAAGTYTIQGIDGSTTTGETLARKLEDAASPEDAIKVVATAMESGLVFFAKEHGIPAATWVGFVPQHVYTIECAQYD